MPDVETVPVSPPPGTTTAEIVTPAKVKESSKETTILTQKPDGEKKLDVKADDKKSAAPDKYDLKLSDGSLLEAAHVEKIAAYARERGFSQDVAQQLLAREESAVKGYHESQLAAFKEQTKAWVEDVKADKELGGDNYSKSVESAYRVVEKFGTPAFKEALASTGLGNHPELVRVFAKIEKAIGNDAFIRANSQGGSKRKTDGEVFYGEKSESGESKE